MPKLKEKGKKNKKFLIFIPGFNIFSYKKFSIINITTLNQ